MKLEFGENKILSRILTDDFEIPFSQEHGLSFYLNDEFLKSGDVKNGIEFSLDFKAMDEEALISAVIKNTTDEKIEVESLGLRLGTDTYMEKYPEWNSKFFPTMLRCEKTHFWGYFQSPEKKSFAIVVKEPVASYHLEYNMLSERDFGHRIYTACLDFFKSGKLPQRNPKQSVLEPNTEYNFGIHIIPLNSLEGFAEKVSGVCGLRGKTWNRQLQGN